MPNLRPKLTFANAIALIALFVALGGTVYAAAKINGKTIRKESIPANRLKADSLTGAQVNESSLATVPSAENADTAEKALAADRATSAQRAETATRATRADRAGRVESAAEADRAQQAETAALASDAQTIGGLPSSKFVRAGGCQGDTIKGAALVRPDPVNATKRELDAASFNCAGQEIEVKPRVLGEYLVVFPGLVGGIPVVSPLTPGSDAAVRPVGEGEFRVTVFKTPGTEGLVGRPFVLAIL